MSTSSLGRAVVRKYLVHALTGDTGRLRPPITLAGAHANGGTPPRLPPPPIPAAPPSSTRELWEPDRRTRHSVAEAEPGDEQWTYSRKELLRMDARFRARLLKAFERGKESREAAAALYDGCVRRPASSPR
jgi:hypothetical protein